MKKTLIALMCLGVMVSYASQPAQPTEDLRPKMDEQTQQMLKQKDRERTSAPTYQVPAGYPNINGAGRAILFHEDFEAGLPGTWKVIDGNADGYSWVVGTTGDLGYDPPGYGTAYAYYSDDDAGSGAPIGNEYLYSPHVYTGGAPSIFHYAYGFNLYLGGEYGTSEYQYHDGTGWSPWIILATYDSDGNGVDTFNLVAAESVAVRFVYYDLTGQWGWAFGIDNVFIESPLDHDVGCGGVLSPPDGLIAPGAYDIIGRIENYGLNAETFWAYAEVWDMDLMVMLWSTSVPFVDFVGSTDHTFGTFTIGEDMKVCVKIYTQLVSDERPENDLCEVCPRTALALCDIVFEMDCETPTGDMRCLGVEFDGTYFYVTGGGDYYNTSYVHVLDTVGNLICQPFQPPWCLYGWGWRDMCNGCGSFCASMAPYIDDFDVDVPNCDLTYKGSFPGPLSVNRALAYDSKRDLFYTADFSSPIYKGPRDGSWPHVIPNPGPWAMFGAAYDYVGDWVWWHSQDGPDPNYLLQIEQVDADSQVFTDFICNYYPTTLTGGVAGGLDFYAGFRGYDVLFALVQGTPHDAIVGLFVRKHDPKIDATITFAPRTLNLSSVHPQQKVWCFIVLDSGSVYDIDPSTIRIEKINGVPIDPVYSDGSAGYSADDDTLKTRFWKTDLVNAMSGIVIPPAYVELYVRGDINCADFAGTGMIRVISPQKKHDGVMGAEIPVAFALHETSPNPFSSHAVIRYALPLDTHVKLTIYDVNGRIVKDLVNSTMEAGYYNIRWDGQDNSGRKVSNGVYLLKFEAEDYKETRKLILLR